MALTRLRPRSPSPSVVETLGGTYMCACVAPRVIDLLDVVSACLSKRGRSVWGHELGSLTLPLSD